LYEIESYFFIITIYHHFILLSLVFYI